MPTPLCILCSLMPKIIPLLTLTLVHMWYEKKIRPLRKKTCPFQPSSTTGPLQTHDEKNASHVSCQLGLFGYEFERTDNPKHLRFATQMILIYAFPRHELQ